MRHHEFESENDGDEQQVQVFFEGKTDQDRYIELMEAGLNAQHLEYAQKEIIQRDEEITQKDTELDQDRIRLAISILEKSWFWRFRQKNKKLQMIQQIYSQLSEILFGT